MNTFKSGNHEAEEKKSYLRNGTDEAVCRARTETDTEMNMWARWQGEGEANLESRIDMCAVSCVKQKASGELP